MTLKMVVELDLRRAGVSVKMIKIHFCILLLFFSFVSLTKVDSQRVFEIDYANNTFLKDGIPFRYVSGSLHYSRVVPFYWQDRLRKMRASGLNAVQGYIPWNVHELTPGNFTWEGASDLPQFLRLAQQEDLVVLLRLGPYICGEWEFGGFPGWLLSQEPMVFRTSDPAYIKWVDLWYTELLNKIKPFLYKNGGPVVMVQIENEYGSYFACDKDYMLFLRNKVTSVLGHDVVIYTTDGSGDGFLKCGKVDGVYATVDFGSGGDPVASFKPQRDYEKYGPLVNSEYYTGWLDHWGQPHSHGNPVTVAKSLDAILSYKPYTNVNLYMFVGGTNFEYMNGANEPKYQPVPTSYDYEAPVSESGDINGKFYAIRDIVSKYLPLPSTPIPPNTNKTNYGSVNMKFVCTVQDAVHFLTPEGPKTFKFPVPMEAIQFYKGFIMYRHILKKDFKTPTALFTRGTRDRAIVMVNGVPFGILDREVIMQINITGSAGQQLDILVENQGRVGFSTDMNFSNKGLVGNVTLGGELLTDWLLYPLHTENINESAIYSLRKYGSSLRFRHPLRSTRGSLMTPSIYTGTVTASSSEGIQDTFLDPRPFQKGQAFVNNFNLGRYWPFRGPQVRLYVPKPVFHSFPAVNHLYLFELENAPCFESNSFEDCQITLTDTPYLDGPNLPDPMQEHSSIHDDDGDDNDIPNWHLVH